MTKTTYAAFGVLRTSTTAYTWASRDHRWGVVRFHRDRAAAERMVGNAGAVEPARIATTWDIAADRAAKAAVKAERAAKQADFDRRWTEHHRA